MKISELAKFEEDDLVLGCNCAGCCTVVRLHRFAVGGEGETWVEFFQSVREHPTLRYRLSAAWQIIRGRRDWSECMVLGDQQLDDLSDWLQGVKVGREIEKRPLADILERADEWADKFENCDPT